MSGSFPSDGGNVSGKWSYGTEVFIFGFDNHSMALLDDHGKQDMIPLYLVFRLFNQ